MWDRANGRRCGFAGGSLSRRLRTKLKLCPYEVVLVRTAPLRRPGGMADEIGERVDPSGSGGGVPLSLGRVPRPPQEEAELRLTPCGGGTDRAVPYWR